MVQTPVEMCHFWFHLLCFRKERVAEPHASYLDCTALNIDLPQASLKCHVQPVSFIIFKGHQYHSFYDFVTTSNIWIVKFLQMVA